MKNIIINYLILTTTVGVKYYYYFHFSDKKQETRRDQGTQFKHTRQGSGRDRAHIQALWCQFYTNKTTV